MMRPSVLRRAEAQSLECDTRVQSGGGAAIDAQWSKRGGESAINSNDSFMPSKWYQIEGLIERISNLAKKN